MNEIDLIKGAYALGRDSLKAFSILTDKDYRPSRLHIEIAKKLEAVENGLIKRLIIEVPPRHGKTQLATINFPAWFLGRHPDREVIVAAYNAELAQDFGAKTRDLVASSEYRSIFGAVKLKEDTQSKARWATEEKGSYTSVGVGGTLTGRGADLLIIDDPVKNRQEAESDLIRRNIKEWYTSTARTRLEKDAAVIVIMTRWHVYDLVGELLAAQEGSQDEGSKWERITFPAIATQDEEWRTKGQALWPEKYDEKALYDIKADIDIKDWLALYQQTPILSETADFKAEWFRRYEAKDLMGKQLVYYTAVDLAISAKDGADNTVVRTIAKQRNAPDVYLIEEHAGKFDPLQTIEIIFQHVAAYKPLRVGIESVAYQKSLSYFIKEEQRKKGVYFDIIDIKQGQADKETRLRGLIPMYKAGVIWHRPTADSELEAELLQFPQGKHDDRIDALKMTFDLIEQPTNYGQTTAQQFRPNNFAYRRQSPNLNKVAL
jgi:predicted phage terminase large subunit-like protein